MLGYFIFLLITACSFHSILTASSGWNDAPDTQYHIQTDEGPERYFRYQTISGQYRKEKRLEDGTVVGSYGWVDANGYLRMRDYIADNQGYRILKTKNIFVGKERHIGQAVSAAKSAPDEAGILVTTDNKKGSTVTPIYNSNKIGKRPIVEITHNSYPSSTETPILPSSTPVYVSSPQYYQPTTPNPRNIINPIASNDLDYAPESTYRRPQIKYYQNGPTYPIDRNGIPYTGRIGNGYDNQYPYYDGIAVTNDGFRYYLPKQYHEEQSSASGYEKAGSFGYIDPFGIRRVIYYNAAPGTGFQHRKNNRYVGHNATPYDPRPFR